MRAIETHLLVSFKLPLYGDDRGRGDLPG